MYKFFELDYQRLNASGKIALKNNNNNKPDQAKIQQSVVNFQLNGLHAKLLRVKCLWIQKRRGFIININHENNQTDALTRKRWLQGMQNEDLRLRFTIQINVLYITNETGFGYIQQGKQ